MHTLLKECEACSDLSHLLKQIDCTILYLSKNRDFSIKYNVELYFNQNEFNDLVRYKRIVERRIYSCNYPDATIKTSDIIAYATKLAFRDGNCSQCESCFPEQSTASPNSTTSTSTTTTSNTP